MRVDESALPGSDEARANILRYEVVILTGSPKFTQSLPSFIEACGVLGVKSRFLPEHLVEEFDLGFVTSQLLQKELILPKCRFRHDSGVGGTRASHVWGVNA